MLNLPRPGKSSSASSLNLITIPVLYVYYLLTLTTYPVERGKSPSLQVALNLNPRHLIGGKTSPAKAFSRLRISPPLTSTPHQTFTTALYQITGTGTYLCRSCCSGCREGKVYMGVYSPAGNFSAAGLAWAGTVRGKYKF